MEFTPDAKRAFHLQTYGPAPVIDGVALVPLARHVDDGGAMTELVRLNDGLAEALSGFTVRQVNISELAPGRSRRFTSTCARPTCGTSVPGTACWWC